MNEKLILAHRGFSSISPENTKLSFDLAYLFGFDGVELDVHLTKDKKLVIIHDENTIRTSKINSIISKSNLIDLEKQDMGAFWKLKLPNQKILTLEEFLHLYIDKFKIINIEIKTDVEHYVDIEKIIYQVILPFKDKWDKLVFSSFNFESLEILNQMDKNIQLAFLWWTKGQFNKIDPEKFKFIKYFNPWIEIYFKDIEKYDSFSKKYMFWTIKSSKSFKKFQKMEKAFCLISNYLY
ncbi:glycerophosphodiester phosphodiesterase family protein [[Mycoplasma] mobile]|uniref:Glycerophosphoryl diester phosphodiesterase n=1 Tax=Mycoplasma mobile (strain ATCC 43663 / 163K / NCTC 11711) TaxID=267748 RepID=Q6KI85_MYCM1|nr:glycerophosphodiester phosphodiesterase family protein [[Mycoplasma] mobile]AAT27691.1 glycerophosphoryl diester phosphodiesterase [Mycoplasma mobile 163K]